MPTWQRKKYYKLAKGFYGRSKNCMRTMAPRVEKSLQYAYRDRQVRPRLLRKGWIMSINAAVREHSINYSWFVNGLTNSNIDLNRKILTNLAINEPYSFKAVVDEIKIQGKLVEKPKPQIDFLEALSKGLITQGNIFEKKLEVVKSNYFGERKTIQALMKSEKVKEKEKTK